MTDSMIFFILVLRELELADETNKADIWYNIFNFIYFRIKVERLTTRLNKKEEQIKEHQARQEIDGLKRSQENLEKMKQHHNNYEKEMVKEN